MVWQLAGLPSLNDLRPVTPSGLGSVRRLGAARPAAKPSGAGEARRRRPTPVRHEPGADAWRAGRRQRMIATPTERSERLTMGFAAVDWHAGLLLAVLRPLACCVCAGRAVHPEHRAHGVLPGALAGGGVRAVLPGRGRFRGRDAVDDLRRRHAGAAGLRRDADGAEPVPQHADRGGRLGAGASWSAGALLLLLVRAAFMVEDWNVPHPAPSRLRTWPRRTTTAAIGLALTRRSGLDGGSGLPAAVFDRLGAPAGGAGRGRLPGAGQAAGGSGVEEP